MFQWSKAAWIALQLFGIFGFVHVLVNPDNGTADFEGRTAYLGILLLIYLVLAAAVWAFVRWRAGVSDEPPPGRSGSGLEEPLFESPPGPQSQQAPAASASVEDWMWWRAMQASAPADEPRLTP